jgi:molecular chaperone GrpE
LQEYKNDLILKIARPIFIDLIQLHDDMGKMADSLGDDRASGLLRDFQQGIEDILYRQEVEPFRNEGEGFDPRRQRAVSTVSTDDPGRDKTIAARLRPGFAIGEKVIRLEWVSVYAMRRPPGDGRGPDAIDE